MVFQESKDLVIEYIKKRNGEATKNNVADYMADKDVRYPLPKEYKEYGTTRVTTYDLLKDLEEAGRIIVVKGIRNGQRHKLIYRDRNDYDHISNQIENIGLMLGDHPEAKDLCRKQVAINLARTVKYIKNENDKQTLIKKIADLSLKIEYGKEGLSSQV